jgi:HSP20 family protein
MANLLRRGNGGEPQQQGLARREFDPMRLMRDMMRWDPFREMMPSLFGMAEPASFSPAFEVAEHKDRFVFKADMPGVKESDLDVKLTGNRLTVTGKRESEHEEKADTYYACERSYGSFTRAFTLPPEQVDLDHVTAELKNGVLSVVIPKRMGAQSRQIAIKGGAAQRS